MEFTPKIERDFWNICEKIREVVNHIKFNFREHYSIYDPKNTGFVTVFIFKNVLDGPLKKTINLNDEEIQLLVKYYENSDGQVQYEKFCQLIHNESVSEKEHNTTNANEAKYTKQDLTRLNVMKKIANDLHTLHISLEPYFDDYKELTGHKGLMTVKQFVDMFYALKIQISPEEMQLIINKLIVYRYMIDKNKFLDELNWVKINDPQSLFPETTIDDSIKNSNARLYSNQNVFHPVITNKTQKKHNVITTLRNVQKHVLENRIDIGQFFEPYDPFRKGYVTEKRFRRCLDMMGVSKLHGLYFSESELSKLLLMYKDRECPDRINWKKFEEEINTVFTEKKLKKDSEDVEIRCSLNVLEMLRMRGQDWEAVEMHLRQLFNVTILSIRNYLNETRVHLEQFFKVFDKNKRGHISRSSFRRAMVTAGIQCSEDELSILEKRFVNVDGFNYLELLKLLTDIDKNIKKCSNYRNDSNASYTENLGLAKKTINITISKLMTRIKITVKRGRIKIDQFLNQFDSHNHRVMPKSSFQRALNMAGIKVDSNELEILFKEFDSKAYPGHVEYWRFCNMIEEAFVTMGLERTPSVHPKEYLTSYEGPNNYLTDEEKNAVNSALTKLRSKPNLGLDDLYKDYDKFHQGIVSMNQFLGALTVRKLDMLSTYEVECLKKAFSREGRPITFNYREFTKTIDNI